MNYLKPQSFDNIEIFYILWTLFIVRVRIKFIYLWIDLKHITFITEHFFLYLISAFSRIERYRLLFCPFWRTLELWRLNIFVSIVCFMPEMMAIFSCYFDSPITKMVWYQVQNISNLFWPILRRYPNY